MKNRRTLATVLIALLLSVILGELVYLNFRDKAERRLELDYTRSLTAYRSITESYREFAEITASWIMADSGNLALMRELNAGSETARGELYRRLSPMYGRLYPKFIRVLQFTGKSGLAQLRMHAPEVAGDDARSRRMIDETLTQRHPHSGFEYSPRISGYRFVYPVIDRGELLGALEIGVSFTAIRRLMEEEYGKRDNTVRFLLDGGILESVLGGPSGRALMKTLYLPSPVSPKFFTQNLDQPLFEEPPETLPDFSSKVEQRLGKNAAFAGRMESGEGSSLQLFDGMLDAYLVHLIPVRGADGKANAFILSYSPDAKHGETLLEALAIWLSGSLTIAVLSFLQLKALRSGERLATVSEHVGQGIFVQDAAGTITYINPRACDILGYTRNELQGKHAHQLFHQHSDGLPVGSNNCNILNVCESGQTFFGDGETFKTKSGKPIPVEVTATPVMELGTVTEVVTVFSDISERMATQTRLRQSDAALNQATEGIFISDTEFRISFINRAFTDITGYCPADAVGKNMTELMSQDADEIIAALRDRQEWHGELNERRKDGAPIPVWLSLAAISDLNGDISSYVGIFSDISEIRSKDALLIQQSRLAAMGEMVHNIAHQWRQPINALGLIFQNLNYDFNDGALDRDGMESQSAKAMKLINGMSRTIDDFRNFFRPDYQAEDFDPAQPIEEAVAITESSLGHHNIRLEKNLQPGLAVHGHSNQFAQAVLNLVANAKEAIIDRNMNDGCIALTLQERDGHALLIVEDNAGGIPQDMLAKIFDPYFTTKKQGSGIGLYMTRTIVERNLKGTLTVVNGEAGARFTASLPLAGKPTDGGAA